MILFEWQLNKYLGENEDIEKVKSNFKKNLTLYIDRLKKELSIYNVSIKESIFLDNSLKINELYHDLYINENYVKIKKIIIIEDYNPNNIKNITNIITNIRTTNIIIK